MKRLDVVRRLLADNAVSTQERLAELLRSEGHEVTQSSVSRDLYELGVAKVSGRYVVGQVQPTSSLVAAGLVASLQSGPNLIVVKTATGAASRIGLLIDEGGFEGVVGTLAGDDTVFVATDGEASTRRLVKVFLGEESNG